MGQNIINNNGTYLHGLGREFTFSDNVLLEIPCDRVDLISRHLGSGYGDGYKPKFFNIALGISYYSCDNGDVTLVFTEDNAKRLDSRLCLTYLELNALFSFGLGMNVYGVVDGVNGNINDWGWFYSGNEERMNLTFRALESRGHSRCELILAGKELLDKINKTGNF